MAFGGLSEKHAQQPMAEINMIPLIDVMLVLLIIFIITAPLVTHAVKVDLPKASSAENDVKPEHIELSLNAAGEVFWNGERVDEARWRQRMAEAAALPTPPELHLRADGELAYRKVVQVMSDAARAGLTKIGFVTEPVAPGKP